MRSNWTESFQAILTTNSSAWASQGDPSSRKYLALELTGVSEMRDEAFAFVTVVLVVISAMAGYYAGGALNHGTTTTTTTMSFVPASCSTPVSATVPTEMIQVYQMNPGSVAVICINYQFASAGNSSFGLLGGPECVSRAEASGLSPMYSCDLELTPSISSFDHLAGQNVTVAYLIQSDENATGVYWFGGVCSPVLIPFVVGTLPTSLTYPFAPVFCIYMADMPSGATVTGVTGLSVSLVTYK